MATPVFSITAAYIVGLAVQCSFYGLALATFFLCVRALCALPFSAFPRSRWALLAVSTAMILVGTLSVGQAIAHNLVAFVYYKDGLAAQEELLLNQDPAIWIHSITYPVQGFLGDSVLVYRTWIVNSYDWRFIAFPVLLVIGSAVSGWGIVASVGSGTIGAYLNKSVVPWTDAFLVTSITLNVLCTGMIIWRIISVRGRSSGLQLVQRVVIESGFLYTLTSLLFLITNLMKSASVYVVADAYLQIIPICFNMIIIRTSNIHEDSGGRYNPTRAESSSGGAGGALSTLPVPLSTFDRSVPFFPSTYEPEADKHGIPMLGRGRSVAGTENSLATPPHWSSRPDSKLTLSTDPGV